MPKLSGPMVPPQTGEAPTHAIVLLHGYGSDGSDLIGLAPYLQQVLPGALVLAPNAPEPSRMVSLGFQWFEIALEGNKLASRQAGVAPARPVLIEFLHDLWAQTGIAPEKTILAGFSQGAMMALNVGLSLEQKLMGIVAVAGALLPVADFGTASYAKPPVCLVHGDHDEVVEPHYSRQADAQLRQAGFNVSYHVSPGAGHGIAPDGLEFALEFIRSIAAE